MKVFISQPVYNRDRNEVIEENKKIAAAFKTLDIQTVSHLDVRTDMNYEDNEKHPRIKSLAVAIDILSYCDAIYFAENWRNAKGCQIERYIAKMYGMKILETDFINFGTDRED